MQDVDALSRVDVGALRAHDLQEQETWVVDAQNPENVEVVMAPARAVKAAKKAKKARPQRKPGVAQVDMEEVWGFDTELKDIDELQRADEEVKIIRAMRAGTPFKEVEAVPVAKDAIAKYLSLDPTCDEFVEGADGRLNHLAVRVGSTVSQLYVPLEMRGSRSMGRQSVGTGQRRKPWPSCASDTTGHP
jgi:hypothetical protein